MSGPSEGEPAAPDGATQRAAAPPRPIGPRHFGMLRTFVLADFITLGNAACGTGALFLCLHHLDSPSNTHLPWVFLLLPLALVFDVADGAVARWRHRQSPLGADLDSLADVVSFGVAPAALGFTLGLRGAWDTVVLVYFVACGISRLARFNATAAELSGGAGKVKYYEGTPIPTSLLLVAVWGAAWWSGAVGDAVWGGELRWLGAGFHPFSLLYAASGSAMISGTLRIRKP